MKLPSIPNPFAKLRKRSDFDTPGKAKKKPKKSKVAGTGGLKLPTFAIAIVVAGTCFFAAVPAVMVLLGAQSAAGFIEGQARVAGRAVRTQVQAGLAPVITTAATIAGGMIDPALFAPALDAERLARAEALVAMFPGAKRVRLLPAGFDELDQEADPPISYADIEQFNSAETQPGKVMPLEVYQFGTPQAHINLVSAVAEGAGDAAKVHGLLAVSYDLSLPRQTLRDAAAIGGYAELVQLAGGKQLVLGRVGNEGHKSGSAVASEKVPGTQWTVHYWPDLGAAKAIGIPLEQLLIVFGGALLLFLLVVYLVFRWLAAALRQDQAVIIKLVTELVERGGRANYPVKLASFRAMVKLISSLSPRMVAAQATSARLQASAHEPSVAMDSTADGMPSGAGEPSPKPDPKGSPLSSLFDDLELPDLGAEAVAAATAREPVEVKVPSSIFRAYDIRGIVGSTLNPGIARQIGLTIGSAALDRGQQAVVVARDGRLSGPQMLDALSDGLQASGRDVINIGLVPTPVLYFATHHLGAASGVMVTGSHNPPDYNGFKIVLDGEALSGEAIQGLYQRLETGDLSSGAGGTRDEKIIADYVDRIVADVHLSQPLKVVIDCGNGAAGAVAPALFSALGCEVIELYCKVDGQFPNHHPDPSQVENLLDLIETVQREGADIGLAFDGDGDRLGVIDSQGNVIWPDRLMMLFARDLLSRHPDAEILFDVKCSRNLASVIKQSGGRPTMWRTGHSLIKARMRESGALLAGEMSGHFFFAERWFGFDDGLYAGARLLEILSGLDSASSEVFAGLPDSVSTPELKITVPDGAQHSIVERLVAQGQTQFPGAEVITIDGLRVEFPEGWGLVRASNTTSNLILRFEADTEDGLKAIQERFRILLQTVESGLELPF